MSTDLIAAVAEAMFRDAWPDGDYTASDRQAYTQHAIAAVAAIVARGGVTDDDIINALDHATATEDVDAVRALLAPFLARIAALEEQVAWYDAALESARAEAGINEPMSLEYIHANPNSHSREKCLRCGWVMGMPPLNCVNDDTPHRFPSQADWLWDPSWPRLQVVADGQLVPMPLASEGKTEMLIAPLGVKVTFEMTPEGLAQFLNEMGMDE
jgi:hypothetical protein